MADYLEREHYINKFGIPDDSGEPKAWVIAFVYMSLMGECREFKPVSAAVQTALQI